MYSARIGLTLLWLAVCALILATIAVVGGGFTLRAASPRISVHNPINPLLAAFVLAGLGVALSGRVRAAQHLRQTGERVDRIAPWIAIVIPVVVFVLSVSTGSFAAGGADASGYLSQARLWEQGSLRVSTPLADVIEPAHDGYAFSPLGFRPADHGSIVPTYPPGYPLMMALARKVAGDGAEYLVVPACAAGLIVVTFALGQRIGGPVVGLLSAAMMSASPTQLFQAAQPMSDVPAAFWWTLSMALLTNASMVSTATAGLAAALASIVRPNLFVLVPLVVLFVMWLEPGWRQRFTRATAFVIFPIAAAVGFIRYQQALYGAGTETGYGSVTELFSFDYVVPNLELYSSWLGTTHTALILLSVVAPFLLARGYADSVMERRRALGLATSLLAVFVAMLGFYCLYFVFDNWTYVRFLLPALSGIFVLTALVVVVACRRLAPTFHVIALLVIFAAVLAWGFARAYSLGVFGLKYGDERYVEVARFGQTLPERAVFLAVQHSGSLSYYTGRPILRWDAIEASELDTVVDALLTHGHHLYFALDDWEEPPMRARFAGTRSVARLSQPLLTTGIGLRAKVFEIPGRVVR